MGLNLLLFWPASSYQVKNTKKPGGILLFLTTVYASKVFENVSDLTVRVETKF